MSLRALATPRPAHPPVAYASLRDGDTLVPDRGFACMDPYPRTVRVDAAGPWVPCDHGRHHLDGQCDAQGNVVGMRRYR